MLFPRKKLKKWRRELPRIMYWIHEGIHLLGCKLLREKGELYFEEGYSFPCAVIYEKIPYWKSIIISTLPVVILFPFYMFDLKSSLIEEILW